MFCTSLYCNDAKEPLHNGRDASKCGWRCKLQKNAPHQMEREVNASGRKIQEYPQRRCNCDCIKISGLVVVEDIMQEEGRWSVVAVHGVPIRLPLGGASQMAAAST